MATLYGVNATLRDNTSPPDLIPQGEVKGRQYIARDTYELSADLDAADVIRMMVLPPLARITDAMLLWDNLDASGGTIDVGWEANGDEIADPNGIFDGEDVTSAGNARLFLDGTTPLAGWDKQFGNAETQISVTIADDTDATSGTITLIVMYVVD